MNLGLPLLRFDTYIHILQLFNSSVNGINYFYQVAKLCGYLIVGFSGFCACALTDCGLPYGCFFTKDDLSATFVL